MTLKKLKGKNFMHVVGIFFFPFLCLTYFFSHQLLLASQHELQLWEKGEIPYTLKTYQQDSSSSPSVQTVQALQNLQKNLLLGMDHYSQSLAGVIRWRNCGSCKKEKNFVVFHLNPPEDVNKAKRKKRVKTCYSEVVGRKAQRGEQKVILHSSCNYLGVIIHHLGHVIGLYHQHQRADRDQYLTLYPQNFPLGPLDPDYAPTFPQSLGVYDENSIMHFSSYRPSNGEQLPTTKIKAALLKKNDSLTTKSSAFFSSKIINQGWPWSPQGTTLRDRSAIWELYSTTWGWTLFQRLEHNGEKKFHYLGAPVTLVSIVNKGQGKKEERTFQQWIRGSDNYLYYRQFTEQQMNAVKALQALKAVKEKKLPLWKKFSKQKVISDPVLIRHAQDVENLFVANQQGEILHFRSRWKKNINHQKNNGEVKQIKQWQEDGKILPPSQVQFLTTPRVVKLAQNNEYFLVSRGHDLKVYVKKIILSPHLKSSSWTDLGGQVNSSPLAIKLNSQQIEFFATDIFGQVWRKNYDLQLDQWWPGQTAWSQEGMEGLLHYQDQKEMIQHQHYLSGNSCFDQNLILLARNKDQVLHTKFWLGDEWGAWIPIGGILKSSVATSCDENKNLHLFMVGEDGEIWHRQWSPHLLKR